MGDAGGRLARRVVGTVAATVLLTASVGAGCAPDALGPLSTAPTDDLAPSQLTASTVARPVTPLPCAAASVEVDAGTGVVAPVAGSEVTVELRILNAGRDRCDVDLGGSPSIDPDMEPDVWLDPGATAVLMVTGRPCGDGAADVVELDVNGSSRSVALPVPACGWRLVAFYPADR